MQVHIKTIHESSAAVGWTGPRTVVIDRTPRDGGMGIGFSGGELLMMSIGASICNTLYHQAAILQIALQQVEIIVNGDWNADPPQAQNLRYDIKVRSGASRAQIEDLLKQTEQGAEVLHTLRAGVNVRLNQYELLKPI